MTEQEENTMVYRLGPDLGESLSTERSTCGDCGAAGWVGDWPDQGGLVADPTRGGVLLCDPCADEGGAA